MTTSLPSSPLAYRRDTKGNPWTVTREGLEAITQMAQCGVSIGTIASHLGMSLRTLERLAMADEDVQAAIDAGRSDLETQITSIMVQQALEGDPGMLKYVHGSVLGKGGNGRETSTPSGHQPSPVTINIPGTMSDEQLETLTAQYRDVTPPDGDQPSNPQSSKKGLKRQ
jgi:hypothetical protein